MKIPLKLRVALLGGVLLLGSLSFWYWQSHAEAQILTASGTLEATRMDLALRVNGRVQKLLAHEGQLLQTGQEILQLDLRDLEAQALQVQAQEKAAQARVALLKAGSRSEDVRSAQAALDAAEWRVKALRNGSRQREIDRAAAEVERVKSQFVLAEQEWLRAETLFASETISRQQFDQAKQSLDAANAALKAAQKSHELLLQGTRYEEIAIAHSQADQQRAQLQKLHHGVRPQELQEAEALYQQAQARSREINVLLEERSLRSPCDCRLSVLGVEKGELLTAGSPAVSLLDPQELWVKVYLSPLELKYVRLHQQVGLRVDAYPEQQFMGQVVYIAAEAEYTPRNIQTREERIHQVFAVKVRVQEGLKQLFAGMPVDVLWPHETENTEQQVHAIRD